MTPATALIRLTRHYLASRRVPTALLALAATGAVLHLILHWTPTTGPFAQQLPLTLYGAVAAIVGATVRSPFGDSERATPRILPRLRLAVTVLLCAAGVGVLVLGATAAHLSGGNLGLVRDVAGLIGVTLLAAALGSGDLAWVGTLSYLLIAVTGIGLAWTTPWLWPTRPSHDTGAALCATAVFAAGLIAVVRRGARTVERD